MEKQMEMQVLKICPPESSLKDCKTEVMCPVPNCNKVVFSSGCLRMHLSRSHGITETAGDVALLNRMKMTMNVNKQYHCPFTNCVYNLNSERHFKNMAGLKQHFLKVHAEKKYKCCKCGHGFGMEKDKRRHECTCGVKFACPTCQCTYLSAEALVLHCLRTQHPVPEEYTKKKNNEKRRSKDKSLGKTSDNEAKPVVSSCVSNGVKLPMILLPVSDHSMKLIQSQMKTVPILPKPMQDRESVHNCSNHLLDHDYLPLGESRNGKQSTGILSSEMQTEISFPPEVTYEAQPLANGNCILSQAMASADLPVEFTSTGTQATSDDKVDIETQVTPKSTLKEHKNLKSYKQVKRRKKLYTRTCKEEKKQAISAHNRSSSSQNLKHSSNLGDEICASKLSNELISYEQENSSIHGTCQLRSSEDTGTDMPINNVVTQVSGIESKQRHKGSNGMASSLPGFDFAQTVGVQTHPDDYQDFLLFQSSNSSGVCNSIGINTENKHSNKCVGNTALFSDSHVQTVDFDLLANSPEPQIQSIHTETQTVDLDIDSLESLVSSIQTQTASPFDLGLSSTNVETQTRNGFSSVDSQTFAFDFGLSCTNVETQTRNGFSSVDSQTLTFDIGLSSANVETQTRDGFSSVDSQTLAFDLGLSCTNVETQTRNGFSSVDSQTLTFDIGLASANVETQTRDGYSSVDSQTLTNSPFDCGPMESINIETQTYDGQVEFIELLSSGTQTLGYIQDAPLSHMETQTTARESNSSVAVHFGTQTSVIENSQKSINNQFNPEQSLSNESSCSVGTETSYLDTSRKKSDYQSEQMEFLVSEVLEMIPVTAHSYSKNSQKISKAIVPCEEVVTADVGVTAEIDTGQLSNSHTQTILDTSTIQTQTSDVHELTNSETQTVRKGSTMDIDLTDSHTQTTWKELNDLLAELDR